AQRGALALPAPPDFVDKVSLGALLIALIAWATELPAGAVGVLFLVAGASHAVRLARWRGWLAVAEPLVLILHVGYAWLPLGLVLMGAAKLAPDVVSPYAALHALTAGAMGTMTLAVMTRASLGHTGREKTADVWTVAIYALVLGGALLRVFGSILFAPHYVIALLVAASLWSAAYALFAIRYGPMLWQPRRGEVQS
ncbi:MAG: NnrS family protein, partial [Parvularculaceae bacterium]